MTTSSSSNIIIQSETYGNIQVFALPSFDHAAHNTAINSNFAVMAILYIIMLISYFYLRKICNKFASNNKNEKMSRSAFKLP